MFGTRDRDDIIARGHACISTTQVNLILILKRKFMSLLPRPALPLESLPPRRRHIPLYVFQMAGGAEGEVSHQSPADSLHAEI